MPDDDPQDSPPGDDPKGLRKLLEAEKSRNDDLASRLQRMERREILDVAGIPKDAKFFRDNFDKVYSGDLTAEAVRKYAEDNGIIKAVSTTPQEEQDVHRQLNDALAGNGRLEDIRVPQEQLDAINNAKSAEEIDSLAERFGLVRWDAG